MSHKLYPYLSENASVYDGWKPSSLADITWFSKNDIKTEYHIENARMLADLSYLVGTEGIKFDGVTFYLDCDIALCADAAALYDIDLGNDLCGAVSDAFVLSVNRLHGYVTNRVGVARPEDYFNAGVLLMNLKAMREYGFMERFGALLGAVRFDVAQDQDYLNAICRGRRRVIDGAWNRMPGFGTGEPKLVHYNLDNKPWHKDGVEFADIFWHYSDKTAFADEIRRIKKCYRDSEKSAAETISLVDLAEAQGAAAHENKKIRETIERIRL